MSALGEIEAAATAAPLCRDALPAGSLAAWCRDVLLPALVGPVRAEGVAGELVRPGLEDRGGRERSPLGRVALRLACPSAREVRLTVGALTDAACALPPPGGALAAQLLALTGRARDDLAAELAARARDGLPHGARWSPEPPVLELLTVAEAWAVRGPPPPPPAPPPDEAGIARLSARLAEPDDDDRRRIAAGLGRATAPAIWAWRVGRWLVVLRDDPARPPHGGCHVSLVADDRWITAQSCDPWNPPARFALDGDAFAFRRFREHLRRALLARPELDEPRPFGDECAGMGASEDEVAEDPTGGIPIARTLLVRPSEWLLYDRADLGDRNLVDWRVQRDVVAMGADTDPAPADVATWRAFLAEEINPALG